MALSPAPPTSGSWFHFGCLLFAAVWTTAAESAVFYVRKSGSDARACTNPTTDACLTIGRGVAQATGPGDIVEVGPGSYSETVRLTNSGSAVNKIVLRGHDGSRCPTVSHSDPNSRRERPAPTVTITGGVEVAASFVTVACFRITGGGLGTDGPGVSHVDFLDNVLDASARPGSFTGFGIAYTSATSLSQQPSFITIARNYVTRTAMGAFIVANHVVYVDNEHERMTDPTGDADHINLWGEDHLYENNYFWGNVHTDNPGAHSDCWQTFNIGSSMGGDWQLRNARRITLNRNTCFHVNETIITSNSTSDASRMTDWQVVNNVLAFPRLNGGSPGGGGFGSTLNVRFENNTMYGASIGCGRSDSTVTATVSARDNIIFDSSFSVSTNCTLTQSNNLGGTTAAFVNPTGRDFHLQSTSPAIDTGTPGSGLTVDRDGARRSGIPDRGAYEWRARPGGPSPPINLQVTSREDRRPAWSMPLWATVRGSAFVRLRFPPAGRAMSDGSRRWHG